MAFHRRSLMVHSRAAFAAAPATYTGPGDAVPGAYAWWGLQAYTAASIGSRDVVTLHTTAGGGGSGVDSTPFRTIAGGGLDTAAINTFAAGGTLSVRTWHDQTGNGRHCTQTTVANQPLFITSSINGLPAIQWVAANSHKLSSGIGGAGPTDPLTLAQVIKFPSSPGVESNWFTPGTVGGTLLLARRFSTANTLNMYRNASNFSATAADNVAHSILWVYGAATANACDICVDGTSNLGTLATTISPDTINDMNMGGGATFGYADALCPECGVYTSALSGSDKTALYNNQHTRYGV